MARRELAIKDARQGTAKRRTASLTAAGAEGIYGLPKARDPEMRTPMTPARIDGANVPSLAVSQSSARFAGRDNPSGVAQRRGLSSRSVPSIVPAAGKCVLRRVHITGFEPTCEPAALRCTARTEEMSDLVADHGHEPGTNMGKIRASNVAQPWQPRTTSVTHVRRRGVAEAVAHPRLSLCQSRGSIRSQSVLDSRSVSAPCAAPM